MESPSSALQNPAKPQGAPVAARGFAGFPKGIGRGARIIDGPFQIVQRFTLEPIRITPSAYWDGL